jgi:CDP-paratose 2-epimerase
MHDNILVTGGAGFVGSSLAIAIREALPSSRVSVLDNLRRRGSELNLGRLRGAGVRFVHGDIRSLSDLIEAGVEPDLIIECSAEPSVLVGYGSSPAYLINTNLMGCFHCLELARHVKADFIFVSTSRVYPIEALNGLAYAEKESRFELWPEQPFAGASELGIAEDFPLDGARSLYGMTKLAGELMVQEYADAYGFQFLINRCGLITGPWQMARSDQGVIAFWVAAHLFGRPLRYIGFGGSGKQVRDFLDIADLCTLIVEQIRNFPAYAGKIFNVGGGLRNTLSLMELTDLCRQITGRAVPVSSSDEERPADIRIYISDHRRVSQVSGWKPARDAHATIAGICNWLSTEETVLRPLFAE